MNISSRAVPVVQTVVELPGLVENLLLLLSDKEKVVIQKRFDLRGVGKHTLEEIGQEFSVTRERIRQIEKNALSKMRRNVFNTALSSLHEFVALMVNKSGGLIKRDTLVDEMSALFPQDFSFDVSALNLTFALHEDFECVGNTIDFHPYIRERNLKDYSLKHVSKNLVNQLHKYGDAKNLSKLYQDLSGVLADVDFDVTKVKSLIDIDKRLTLVDDEFVALVEWRHIHPRTLRDKILYTLRKEKKSMHFMSLAEKISEAKFDNRPVNLQAVHNELIRYSQFVLIGRGIYALSEWGYESGTVADVIERVLKQDGELDQDEIIDKVLNRRQVKRITIVLALKNSKKFERVGRRRYKLRA